uniref:PCNA-interacting partner n=3 Tax=Macrostomum lignano TaxID=282301 RepID=A0A1I8GZD4_9PLAT
PGPAHLQHGQPAALGPSAQPHQTGSGIGCTALRSLPARGLRPVSYQQKSLDLWGSMDVDDDQVASGGGDGASAAITGTAPVTSQASKPIDSAADFRVRSYSSCSPADRRRLPRGVGGSGEPGGQQQQQQQQQQPQHMEIVGAGGICFGSTASASRAAPSIWSNKHQFGPTSINLVQQASIWSGLAIRKLLPSGNCLQVVAYCWHVSVSTNNLQSLFQSSICSESKSDNQPELFLQLLLHFLHRQQRVSQLHRVAVGPEALEQLALVISSLSQTTSAGSGFNALMDAASVRRVDLSLERVYQRPGLGVDGLDHRLEQRRPLAVRTKGSPGKSSATPQILADVGNQTAEVDELLTSWKLTRLSVSASAEDCSLGVHDGLLRVDHQADARRNGNQSIQLSLGALEGEVIGVAKHAEPSLRLASTHASPQQEAVVRISLEHPEDVSKKSDRPSGVETAAVVPWYSAMTAEISRSGTLYARSTSGSASLTTESKAFLKSTKIRIRVNWRMRASSMTRRRARICVTVPRWGRNPFCSGHRYGSSTVCNRDSSMRLNSFAAQDCRQMPRCSSSLVVPGFFGMATMCAVVHSFGATSPESTRFITLATSVATQWIRSASVGTSSGPSALPPGDCRANFTTSAVLTGATLKLSSAGNGVSGGSLRFSGSGGGGALTMAAKNSRSSFLRSSGMSPAWLSAMRRFRPSVDDGPGHAPSGIGPCGRDGLDGVIDSGLLPLQVDSCQSLLRLASLPPTQTEPLQIFPRFVDRGVVLPDRLPALGRSHQRDCLLRSGSNCSAHLRVLGSSTLVAQRSDKGTGKATPRLGVPERAVVAPRWPLWRTVERVPKPKVADEQPMVGPQSQRRNGAAVSDAAALTKAHKHVVELCQPPRSVPAARVPPPRLQPTRSRACPISIGRGDHTFIDLVDSILNLLDEDSRMTIKEIADRRQHSEGEVFRRSLLDSRLLDYRQAFEYLLETTDASLGSSISCREFQVSDSQWSRLTLPDAWILHRLLSIPGVQIVDRESGSSVTADQLIDKNRRFPLCNNVASPPALAAIYDYMCSALNCRNVAAFARVFNAPARGLSHAVFTELRRQGQAKGLSPLQIAQSFVGRVKLGGSGYAPDPADPLHAHSESLSELVKTFGRLCNALDDCDSSASSFAKLVANLLSRDSSGRFPASEIADALSIVSKLKTDFGATVDCRSAVLRCVDFIACGCYPQPQVESRLLASQSPSPRGRIPVAIATAATPRRGYASAGLVDMFRSPSLPSPKTPTPTRRHRMTAVAGGRNDSDGIDGSKRKQLQRTPVLAPAPLWSNPENRTSHLSPVVPASPTPLASVAKVNSGLSNQIQETSPKQPLTSRIINRLARYGFGDSASSTPADNQADDKPRRSSTGSVAPRQRQSNTRANAAGAVVKKRKSDEPKRSASSTGKVKIKKNSSGAAKQSRNSSGLASNSAGVKSRLVTDFFKKA